MQPRWTALSVCVEMSITYILQDLMYSFSAPCQDGQQRFIFVNMNDTSFLSQNIIYNRQYSIIVMEIEIMLSH